MERRRKLLPLPRFPVRSVLWGWLPCLLLQPMRSSDPTGSAAELDSPTDVDHPCRCCCDDRRLALRPFASAVATPAVRLCCIDRRLVDNPAHAVRHDAARFRSRHVPSTCAHLSGAWQTDRTCADNSVRPCDRTWLADGAVLPSWCNLSDCSSPLYRGALNRGRDFAYAAALGVFIVGDAFFAIRAFSIRVCRSQARCCSDSVSRNAQAAKASSCSS